MSDITSPSRFLLPEKLVGSSFFIVLSPPFHLFQFLSNFLKYSFSNFPLFYLYNILAIYFPSNSPLLMFFSSARSSFSYLLTSIFILPLNSTTSSFVFSKSSSFSQLLWSTINLFHCTKYFMTLLTFCLFKILSTSYSSTPFTSIGLTFSFLCSPLDPCIVLLG